MHEFTSASICDASSASFFASSICLGEENTGLAMETVEELVVLLLELLRLLLAAAAAEVDAPDMRKRLQGYPVPCVFKA